MRWAGHVACIGEKRKVYMFLGGELKGKRLLRKPRHRWDQNGLHEDRLGGCGVAEDRGWWQILGNMVMNLQILALQNLLVS
jgi:hypothetical protein